MKYPTLSEQETSRQMVDAFRGYNHNLRIGDGEFFDMKNMTSDYYPVLSPRRKRGVYASPGDPQGMIAKDSLCYVDGTDFVVNGYPIDMGLSTDPDDCPKRLVSMGAYVIILPDKKYINTADTTDFRRISTDNIMSRLKHIASNENISLTDDGARVIARVSRGGMRDAVSLLELCAGARKTVDEKLVFETVGTGNRDSSYRLIEAILKQDYTAVYSTVNEVVMNSADISVFWQEIIDSYRDIMVVKNTERAKDYLDLTEVEYEALTKLAKEFTPARLAYHVSLLEGAMADMQRAFNSKRSIAEIALTRMCDAKSSASPEALALRVDELERELSMMKLGVGTAAKIVNDETNVKVLPTVKIIEEKTDENADNAAKNVAESVKTPESSRTVKYEKWSSVVERIGELKCSLSVQFMKSQAYRKPDGTFLIRMNSFFANKLSGSNDDLSILRGILAEKENLPAEEIRVNIEPLDTSSIGDFSDEIESNIGSADTLF